jgi:hypothetical protein
MKREVQMPPLMFWSLTRHIEPPPSLLADGKSGAGGDVDGGHGTAGGGDLHEARLRDVERARHAPGQGT